MDRSTHSIVSLWGVFLLLSISAILMARGSMLHPGFFTIANSPEIGHHSVLYIYAINSDTNDGTIEFSKPDGLPSDVVETGTITPVGSPFIGCYLRVSESNSQPRFRYGVYNAKFTSNEMSLSGETFVKAPTDLLDTSGVYTVTIYPASDEGDVLSCPVSIGVKPTRVDCRKVVWCKNSRRRVNSGPRLPLTSTKDAGLYTISRPGRGQRGWFVQIRVIAASCPEGSYLSDPDSGSCTSGRTCRNGGVLKDKEDICICPPFFTGDDCEYAVPPAISDCPPGWLPWRHFCYFFDSTERNWQDAENQCQLRGGHLASIHCQEEQDFLVGEVTSGNYYFGYNDIDDENSFVYTDGTESDFTSWGGGEPNDNGIEDCTILWDFMNWNWNDVSCFDMLRSICKMPAPTRQGDHFKLVANDFEAILCSDLPGGNPKCRGFLVCYGDNYGCKCSSGWWGNACDRPCKEGRYGPNCDQHCPENERACSRFLGPTTTRCGFPFLPGPY